MGLYELILNMDSGLLVFLLALLVNIFSTLVYKKVTDQKEIRELKKKQKEMQAEIKKLQSHPEKAMKKRKEMMEISGKLMKQSFKPTIYTMIPLLLLFGWINSALIYEPLVPGEPFTVTAIFEKGYSGDATLSSQPQLSIDKPTKEVVDEKVVWLVSGDEGNYFLSIKPSDSEPKKIIITGERKYENPVQKYDGVLKQVIIGNQRVRPFGNFSLFGWKPGMIGAYILLSIIFGIILRKALGVA